MRVIVAVLAVVLVSPALAAAPLSPEVEPAIRRALAERVGAGADVVFEDIRIVVAPNGRVVQAQLSPGGRMGRAFQVRLGTAGPQGTVAWTGAADVRARIAVPHAHAAHTLSRGAAIAPADVTAAHHDIDEGPFARWPAEDEVVGGKVMRNLAAGACLAPSTVSIPPAVQNGQTVVATARVDGVVATARLVAAGSGEPGAIIRVVNQESRRVMKARVVAPGTVEIVP